MALQLHRLNEAQTWRNHLAQTDQAEWVAARQNFHAVNSLIALYTHDYAALSECRDAGHATKDLEARIHLILRGDSVKPHDDPCDHFHAARALLRRRSDDFKNVHIQYDYRLSV